MVTHAEAMATSLAAGQPAGSRRVLLPRPLLARRSGQGPVAIHVRDSCHLTCEAVLTSEPEDRVQELRDESHRTSSAVTGL
ncbi:hypothetical protein AOB60_00045 [Streptomyces noursei]|uniref:Uncharacterized protein n=1 Tax=Streptomyces noursei TaxID=1971 RepID=A0A2N8PQR8_STRNR|nr:hypothetical protein AOB60_00045 [Streptomyces noursei]